MRYGFLSGIFDPVHLGHLLMAEAAGELLNLDRVIFVPTGSPPHKDGGTVLPIDHRLAMLRLATRGNRKFRLSTIEASTDERSYSVETIRKLRQKYEKDDLFWIIGSDNLRNLSSWREPDAIFGLCSLAVYPRHQFEPNSAEKKYVDRAIILNAPMVDISSSIIRKHLKKGRSIRYMVPQNVIRYITDEKIYTDGTV